MGLMSNTFWKSTIETMLTRNSEQDTLQAPHRNRRATYRQMGFDLAWVGQGSNYTWQEIGRKIIDG
jgi:hypothetical protein